MPVMGPDRKSLYFVRSLSPTNTGGKDAGQDVWMSTLQADNTWSKPANLGVPINNESNNAVCGVSPDGNTLYLTNVYGKRRMEPGVSYTKRTGANSTWGPPVALEIAELNIQRGYLGGYMCADEKTLFLTMKSDDAVGREDIYVCLKQADGKWSKPKSLGKTINTVGFEISPFWSEVDSTLYFASNGHEGYGDADIFRSRPINGDFTQWTKPENLGAQVNGDGFDAYLSLAHDSTAFFAKENPEVRYADLYTVLLRDPARKKREDSLMNALGRAEALRKANLDKNNNGVDDRVEGTDKDDRSPDDIYRALNSKRRVLNSDFESILFDFGKSSLRKEGKQILDKAVSYLKGHPLHAIELIGNTDSVDSEIVNLILSDKRSYACKEYLIRKGISRNRILSHGFGKQIYVAENTSATGRQKNRRAELNLLLEPEEFKEYYRQKDIDLPGMDKK